MQVEGKTARTVLIVVFRVVQPSLAGDVRVDLPCSFADIVDKAAIHPSGPDSKWT